MIEVKETVKRDGKIKGCHIVNGTFVDADGEVIDLVETLYQIYGETPFDLSVTTKTEKAIELEDTSEEEEYF